MAKKYHIEAGRTPEQIAKMKQLQESGICAFCPEHLGEQHDNPIEFQTEHWVVTKNDYPYDHTQLHLLLIPKLHVTTLNELGADARAEFLDVVVKIEQRWKLPSYALAMRIGDPRYNGGSVEHLHAHIIVGYRDPEKHQPVRMKLASIPKDD